MRRDSRIYVAGHRGLVGSAICRLLSDQGFANVVTRNNVDLRWQSDTDDAFLELKPEYVFLAAARVGGIGANAAYPADFIRENLQIQTNVIELCHRWGVKRLLFLGSSCIYPKHAGQPIHEHDLMGGPLEPTNEPYAMAKLAGISMCQAYRRQYGFESVCLMPTNLYGTGDNFDPETSHLVPAIMGKMHAAKTAGAPSVTLWGTGTPRRELLHVDDLARAAVHFMSGPDVEGPINIGTGEDLSVDNIATLIASVVGYEGSIEYDRSKPDGTPRKVLNVNRAHSLGWHHTIGLREGLERTYRETFG